MRYFSEANFACRCGCGLLPTAEIMAKADLIRTEWGKPLNCVSGARCMAHTLDLRAKGIPAALKSAHMEGVAIDLCPVNRKDIRAFQDFCRARLVAWDVYMEDPAYCPSWCHMDLRKRTNRVFKP